MTKDKHETLQRFIKWNGGLCSFKLIRDNIFIVACDSEYPVNIY